MGLMACVVAPFVTVPVHAQDYRALLAAPDRSAADRDNDKRRDPIDMLTFIAPRAGMKILDMGAGAGYSTELMARAAGPAGFLFFYHDTTYLAVDRALMNKRLFDALKPGGILAIADYSARPGDDVSSGKSLHRIDETIVKREVEAAGFKLVAEGDFLRHPEDKRDTLSSRAPMPIDEFILKFEKPR